jgi:hypothetical protein
MNGKPGDHPLNDILDHHLEVYGPEADDLIRKIAQLSSRRELDDWWSREIGWSAQAAAILPKACKRLNDLLDRAKQGGWEIPDSGV